MVNCYLLTPLEDKYRLHRNVEWIKKAPKFRLTFDVIYPPKDWKEVVHRMLAFFEGSVSPKGLYRVPLGRYRSAEDTLRTINYYFPEQSFIEVLDYINFLRDNGYLSRQYCSLVKKGTFFPHWSRKYVISTTDAATVNFLTENLPSLLNKFKEEIEKC